MKKIGFIISFVFILYITSGCEYSSPKITEKEAESIAIEHHRKDIKIKSVSHKRGQYIVKWEIDSDCEYGTYYIDDQSGKIVKGEETNC
ncbi:hypothetical protein [Bacillus sp. FJAT-45066]|uniref:hypothetical protein n=1 Tax=Bacillus sp. FJAT-45066 TaxID=2011010 RepID=UPI000BB9956D|nr:hypothetical protein [Bacillus sp. FJAT-45066]